MIWTRPFTDHHQNYSHEEAYRVFNLPKKNSTCFNDFDLIFDSLKIQSCRLTYYSFPDNFNYNDFFKMSFSFHARANKNNLGIFRTVWWCGLHIVKVISLRFSMASSVFKRVELLQQPSCCILEIEPDFERCPQDYWKKGFKFYLISRVKMDTSWLSWALAVVVIWHNFNFAAVNCWLCQSAHDPTRVP